MCGIFVNISHNEPDLEILKENGLKCQHRGPDETKELYIPDENNYIDGYILTNQNDYRFIITAGHHRASVLNAMNILGKFSDKVIVRFDRERISSNYFLINKKDVKKWPAVKNGFLLEEDAILMFDSYFQDKIYI